MTVWKAHISLLAFVAFLGALPVGADEAAALATLNSKGIKKGNSFYLPGEAQLKKKLGEETKLKKSLQQANDVLDEAVQATADNEQAIKLLDQQLILANRNGNAAANNAIIAELRLRDSHNKDLAKAESEARAKANEAREDYITFLVESRKLADQVQQQYQTSAADEEVVEAIADHNKATGKTLASLRRHH